MYGLRVCSDESTGHHDLSGAPTGGQTPRYKNCIPRDGYCGAAEKGIRRHRCDD